MKRARLAVGALLVAGIALAALGYLSNYMEATKLETRIRKGMNQGYASYREHWLSKKRGPVDAFNRPRRLPENLRWLESEELTVVNHTKEKIEMPFNNERGYFSIPNPAYILGDIEYVPKQGVPCPWAFTKKRLWRCPFYVQVDHASQLGPLSGFGGGKAYWSFFGVSGGERDITRWLS